MTLIEGQLGIVPGGVLPPGTYRGLFGEAELAALDTYRVPWPAEWQLRRPALLVVDFVESFVGVDAPIAVAQRESVTACGEAAWRAVEQSTPLLDAFRQANLPVAYTTVSYLPGRHGAARAKSSLRPDVVVAPLAPRPHEFTIAKVRPSAFFGTPLAAWLNSQQVSEVVAIGGTTSGCVRATVLDAYSYGFEVYLPEDACFDRALTSHLCSLMEMDTKYARVVSTAHVIREIGRLLQMDSSRADSQL